MAIRPAPLQEWYLIRLFDPITHASSQKCAKEGPMSASQLRQEWAEPGTDHHWNSLGCAKISSEFAL
jgi:hypothetical protein